MPSNVTIDATLNDYLEILNREGLPGNVKNDVCQPGTQCHGDHHGTTRHRSALCEEELSGLPGWCIATNTCPGAAHRSRTRSGSSQRAIAHASMDAIARPARAHNCAGETGRCTWQSHHALRALLGATA